MRILYITHFLPPRFSAGTETYTLGLAQALMSRGHEVAVLCAEDWDSGENYWNGVTEDTYDGVPVRRIHLNWLKAHDPNRILYDSRPVEEWTDEFLQGRPVDLVHVTSLSSLGVGVLRSVHAASIPLVLTLMDFWFVCPSVQLLRSDNTLCDGHTSAWECQRCLLAASGLFRATRALPLPEFVSAAVWGGLARVTPLARRRGLRGMLLDMTQRKHMLVRALALPDCLVTHSRVVQEFIEQNVPVQVRLLKNGHDLAWISQLRPKAQTEVMHFAYIGQIQFIKGVHLLIEAFNRANLGTRACLDIWGDLSRNTAYAEQLRGSIGTNELVKLRGRYDRGQLADVLSDIDVVVVPSLWYENAPLVIQEAFAASIPVIATDLGGMAEAVADGVNGLLFERGNAEDLATKLRRMVEEPDLFGRLQHGIPPVRAIKAEASELEAIYLSLIRDKRLPAWAGGLPGHKRRQASGNPA